MRREGLAGVLFSDAGVPPNTMRSAKVPFSGAYWVPVSRTPSGQTG